MNNLMTYEDFITDYEIQELEEGKLRDIITATAMASSIMIGSQFLHTNGHKIESKPKVEMTQQMDKLEKPQEYFPSDEILEYIKKTEGWHKGWQDDHKGNLTTGWGFKITKELKKKFPHGMTEKQADKYFIEIAVPERVEAFKKSVPNIEQYTQKQLDALFDLFYNVGEGKFTDGSPKLQAALEKGDTKNIIKNMDHGYNDLPGLKVRRDFERELFLADA